MRKPLLKVKTPAKFNNSIKIMEQIVARHQEQRRKQTEQFVEAWERQKSVRLSYRQACAEIKEYIYEYLEDRDLGHIGIHIARNDLPGNITIQFDYLSDLEFNISFPGYTMGFGYSEIEAKRSRKG
jgi:hypothetical protein